MTRINLLDWRKELREKRKQTFLAMFVATLLLGAGVWVAGQQYLDGRIDHQQYRNSLVEQEIKALDKRIAKIKDLEQTKQRLISRMNVIQRLQQGRTGIVRLFEQLSLTLPEGLYLSSVKQSGDGLAISGLAESNARISSYMENLDNSDWLSDPRLDVIQVSEKERSRVSSFNLRVKQSAPNREEER